MFGKLLIANRGEIACRVIRTARGLGVRTVAVYSDADAAALHVEMADEAARIGPPPPAESCLRGDAIVEAARATGAEAIHPGYGFLSENPDFVEMMEEAALVFVGPSAQAIRRMGLKDAAKAVMEEAGVPVVPGYHGRDQSDERLAGEAARIGWPVLIKAEAIGYAGAGTVEFIADASETLRADRFWFMEMNTRLQVEHPVTEAITGIDLVEWQPRLASGEPLPARQEELSIDGQAMEARLYAEDAAAGFLPATGRLLPPALSGGGAGGQRRARGHHAVEVAGRAARGRAAVTRGVHAWTLSQHIETETGVCCR